MPLLVAAGLLLVPVARQSGRQPDPQHRRRPDDRHLPGAGQLDLRDRPAAGRGRREHGRVVRRAGLPGRATSCWSPSCSTCSPCCAAAAGTPVPLILIGAAVVLIGVSRQRLRVPRAGRLVRLRAACSTSAGSPASRWSRWRRGDRPRRPGPRRRAVRTISSRSRSCCRTRRWSAPCCSASIWYADGDGADAFSTWCRSVLILLIVGRQLLTLLENRHLTRHLESRVAARTAELYASEQRFQALVQQSSDSVTVIDGRLHRPLPERVGRADLRLAGRPADRAAAHRDRRAPGRRRGSPPRSSRCSASRTPPRSSSSQLRHARRPAAAGRDDHDQPARRPERQRHRAEHPGHPRRQGAAGPARARGVPRRADRAGQPRAVPRAAAAARWTAAGATTTWPSCSSTWTASRRSTTASGTPPATSCWSRSPTRLRDVGTRRRHGGPASAATSSPCWSSRSWPRADAETVAHRIIAALDEPFPVGGPRTARRRQHRHRLGRRRRRHASSCMRNADLAMYKAKAAGGSGLRRVRPADARRAGRPPGAGGRSAAGAGARRAGPALPAHGRPARPARSSASRRWSAGTTRPAGMVPPLDFIGVAEATGLIVPLGRWVLTEACRQAVAWGAGTTRRAEDGGERVGAPVRPRRPGRDGGRGAGRDRHAGRPAGAWR